MRNRLWIEKTEEATRQRAPQNHREAKRAFKELPRDKQFELAEEIVETRAAELCRAFKNVIDVCPGYRHRHDKKSGKSRIVRTPCVIFIVKKKWSGENEEDPQERLPKHLFIYRTIGRKRKLCAVPTDVDDAKDYAKIQPQAVTMPIKVVSSSTGRAVGGTITVAIKRSTTGQDVYALSCRHVFCLSKILHPRVELRLPVSVQGRPNVLGETQRERGRLRNAPQHSFDAQLALVSDLNELRLALRGVSIRDFARSWGDIPEVYSVITTRGSIRARKKQFVRPIIDYKRPRIERVLHSLLIRSILVTPTRSGDSGSPYMSGKNGGRFIGMHIAGLAHSGFMIPAWRLLNPAFYSGAGNTESWRLFNP